MLSLVDGSQETNGARPVTQNQEIAKAKRVDRDREHLVANVVSLAKAFTTRHEMSHERDSDRGVTFNLHNSCHIVADFACSS